MNWQQLLQQISAGDVKALARAISLVENNYTGSKELLQLLPSSPSMKIIGITGAPGAGKSSLVDALISLLVQNGKKVAVICVDPSSPFNLGALLGDRIRMNEWYNHPHVFIRSLASRGSFGGLHPKIIEICDLVKAAPYDYVIIETVGVGQSEIEIAGLADATVVVLVPEAGDEIQTMKAGLMEIADVFVVNKSDRPGADAFVKNMRSMLAPAFNKKDPVEIIKTNAPAKEGIADLWQAIANCLRQANSSDKKYWLLAEKAFYLIQQDRLQHINKKDLKTTIEKLVQDGHFNLYQFVASIQ
ncbi:MAG: methylmalonyl Co-A mutase-associated GTPase MeaB [Chitinophagaceae bacterium]